MFIFLTLLSGCTKASFSGVEFPQVYYYVDSAKINNITDGDTIELDNFYRKKVDIYCSWIYNYITWDSSSDVDYSGLPEIQYRVYQGIVYYVYYNEELIDSNYETAITDLEVADVLYDKGIFRKESFSSYSISFSIDVSQKGTYHVVCEANLLINGTEENYSNELAFTII